MTEPAEKKTNGETEKPEAKAPETNPPPQAQQPAPTFRAALVPQHVMQQVIDLLRDEPIPRKKTDPLMAAIERLQYIDVPVAPVKQ